MTQGTLRGASRYAPCYLTSQHLKSEVPYQTTHFIGNEQQIGNVNTLPAPSGCFSLPSSEPVLVFSEGKKFNDAWRPVSFSPRCFGIRCGFASDNSDPKEKALLEPDDLLDCVLCKLVVDKADFRVPLDPVISMSFRRSLSDFPMWPLDAEVVVGLVNTLSSFCRPKDQERIRPCLFFDSPPSYTSETASSLPTPLSEVMSADWSSSSLPARVGDKEARGLFHGGKSMAWGVWRYGVVLGLDIEL